MRIRFIKAYKAYKIGDTLEVSPNEAFGLTDSGYAIIDKMITPDDTRFKTKKVIRDSTSK